MVALREAEKVFALSFDYQQRHKIELERARQIVQRLTDHGANIEHYIQTFDLRLWGGSALTSSMEVPKDREIQDMAHGIPVTYVPARNTVFLAFGAALAEASGSQAVYGGWNVLDYSGYPDCRPEYLQAMQEALRRGTKMNDLTIEAPLVLKSKVDIIKWGLELGAPYDLTWSCYDPQIPISEHHARKIEREGVASVAIPCGRCDSCLLRAKGFAELNTEDPALVTA
jgi:7-cyano-7-deazaguanine synthase